jgi:hypothetical protein
MSLMTRYGKSEKDERVMRILILFAFSYTFLHFAIPTLVPM